MYTSCKKNCMCVTEIYTPTSFVYTYTQVFYKIFTANLWDHNNYSNQFITMVQVSFITRFGLYGIASGPSALGV